MNHAKSLRSLGRRHTSLQCCPDSPKRSSRGAVFNEYIFLILLIFLVLILGVQHLGKVNRDNFNKEKFEEAFDKS